MNKRIINTILRKTVNMWLESIEDPEVRKLAEKNTIITGGSIVSLLLKEEVKDYDLYFRDRATTLAVAKYYVAKFLEKHPGMDIKVAEHGENDPQGYEAGRINIVIASKGVAGDVPEDAPPAGDVYEILPDDKEAGVGAPNAAPEPKYRPVFLSSNAITLSHKIQLVIRFYGEPEQIHDNYDFVHCTNYWTSWDDKVVLKQEALEAILSKELRYIGSKYPLCSVIRTRKFIGRGWTINAGQYLKMLFQISQLDLSDVRVLRDQLVGVDSAYFGMLIDALQSKRDADPEFKISAMYLSELIDRIF